LSSILLACRSSSQHVVDVSSVSVVLLRVDLTSCYVFVVSIHLLLDTAVNSWLEEVSVCWPVISTFRKSLVELFIEPFSLAYWNFSSWFIL